MKKINLAQNDIIHFVGIGGIGMSGLAQVMKNMGFKIQGSDKNKNKNTISCSKAGIKIFIGHSSSNVKKATILVKSSAIKKNNTELKYAKKNKIPIYSRAEILADAVSLKKKYNHYWFSRKNHNNIFSSKNFIRPKIRPNYNKWWSNKLF